MYITAVLFFSTPIHNTMERSLICCSRSFSQCLKSTSLRASPNPFAAIQNNCKSPVRCLHTTRPALLHSRPPKSNDRGPMSNEDTQTDFSALDVLRNTATPATAIDACTSDGFALNNQMRISGCGILLIGGEVFRWRPWLRESRREGTIAGGGTGDDAMTGRLLNAKKQWEVQQGAWGLFELVYPKPGMCRP